MPDKDFEECAENMMKNYENRFEIRERLMQNEISDILRRTYNSTTNQFKTLFDMHGYKLQSLNEWKPMEINRSIELSSNSIYVNFHLDILSKVKGWKLINKTKHPSDAFARVLTNEDNSIYIEIRNNHHTSEGTTKTELEDRFKGELGNPEIKIYIGHIISEGHQKNIEKEFHLSDEDKNKTVTEISGDIIYKIVTGDDSAFLETYKALRAYLEEKYPCKLTPEDEEILNGVQERIF